MIGVSAFLLSTLMATTIPTRTEPVQETIYGVKVAAGGRDGVPLRPVWPWGALISW
jgi:hypothetical protein